MSRKLITLPIPKYLRIKKADMAQEIINPTRVFSDTTENVNRKAEKDNKKKAIIAQLDAGSVK